MLNQFNVKKIILMPALVVGLSFSVLAEEKNIRPNIQVLTSDKTAEKVQSKVPDSKTNSEDQRIPNDVHKSSIGIGLGQTFLRSDLSNNGNDKITADLYYNYSASYSFDFLANFHWSEHSYLNRKSKIEGLAFAIKGKGYQYDAFAPFVFGGFGFYRPNATRMVNGELLEARTQLTFGINAGAGVELRLNEKVVVGVIAHYHDPFDVRQDSGGPLEASYLKLLLTAMYTFN